MPALTRRTFLGATGALTLGAGLAAAKPSLPSPGTAGKPPAERKRLLRAAHLTDIHVKPELQAPEGMAAALEHAQAQPDAPELILFGGDLIMDSLGTTKQEANKLWDLWDKVIADHLRTPARYCLGNHDVWAWARSDGGVSEADPEYGKPLALKRLGLNRSHYSFDLKGWHFIVLDSMQRDVASRYGYVACLGDVQTAWLERDLAAVPAGTPVCVLSHIPILSACVWFDGDLATSGSWNVPGAWMHTDAARIKNIFHRHPNVKVCLSGHIHLADDVTYLGVRYLCNGAVSGGWWKGAFQEFPPAYALVDFYDDGSVENTLVPYGEAPKSSAPRG